MQRGWARQNLIAVLRSKQVPADGGVEVKQEPKIDYTYSGQKKLDLGFGFGTAASAAALDSAKLLSWERMRKVGRI